jgi:hypothetical protein
VVVVFAGYGATYAAYYRPVEQQQARVDRALELADAGRRADAAYEILPAIPTLEAQVRHLPREPVRRLELAFARSLLPTGRDQAAAAADLQVAGAFGNPADPGQARLWIAIAHARR